MNRDEAITRLQQHEADLKRLGVETGVAESDRLRRLERARAPSFADLLLAMPQDDGEFSRNQVLTRDLKL